MTSEVEQCLELLDRRWKQAVYDVVVPSYIKKDREFMDGFNKLKLKNGPMEQNEYITGFGIDNGRFTTYSNRI